MAAKRNPLADKAYELYKSGMMLKEIAERLNLPDGTVRRWKSTYKWECERSDTKSERSDNKRATTNEQTEDGTKETLQNAELTSEQQMFCIYYSRTFNATQSYQKAYGCSYATALRTGPRLLGNVGVKSEIERLKEIKRQQIVAGSEDIVELQMRIAFADIGDYLTFGQESVPVMAMHGPVQVQNEKTGKKETLMKEINVVKLSGSESVDTQLIQEVKQGKDGVSIKLADKQKAIEWLTKYFLMHPESKYRAEYERMRAEKEGGEQQKLESDGFLEALKGDVSATFEGDDVVET